MRLWRALALLPVLMGTAASAQDGVARVAFVGDVMLAASQETGRVVAAGGDPFAQVRALLARADLRVANFEASAGTHGRADPLKPFSFRAEQPAVSLFSALFEAAGLANNHAGDFGRADLSETVRAMRKAGTRPFGAGDTPAQAHRAALFEVKGVKVGLLGYLDFFPRWFAVAPGLPGVAWLDEDQMPLDIARARADGADVVVVMPHWGVEGDPVAHSRQRRLARAMIDAGADAVIGGHPHVVQDHEVYKNKPIFYSLGNFVFDGFEDEDNLIGWMLFADLDRTGVRAIRTEVVRLDGQGAPVPQPERAGPCWTAGQDRFFPCARPGSVIEQATRPPPVR